VTDLLPRVLAARNFAVIAREDGVSRAAVQARFWRELRKSHPEIFEKWGEGTPPLVWVLRELKGDM
jgi:hypothetical protein